MKKNLSIIVIFTIICAIENILLKVSLSFLPDIIIDLIKTIILGITFYLLIQKRWKLRIPLKTTIGIWEQLRVNSLSFVYFILICLPSLIYGFENNPQFFLRALTVGLCAGILEEYIFRGLFLQLFLQEGNLSHKKLIQIVLLSSFMFGCMHLTNLVKQPLDVTLFQVYYAFGTGLYFSAITIRCKSLLWSIILHFLIDFSSVMVTSSGTTQQTFNLPLIIFWFTIGMISIFVLLRKKKVEKII